VGQVTDVDVKCYEMKLLIKSDDNGKIFAFLSKEDRYWVEEEQIIEKLQIGIDQRNKYHFCDPIIEVE
jgi:hypothetical protein